MFCSNCGSPLGDQDKFCKVCGTATGVQKTAQEVLTPAPAAPAQGKSFKGLIRSCFITGLISSILIFIIDGTIFIISGLIIFISPLALAFGADYGDQFLMGLVICFISFLALSIAIAGLVLNCFSLNKKKKRSDRKCNSFRIASSIMTFVVSVVTILPLAIAAATGFEEGTIVGAAMLAIELILAIAHLILAIITNSKVKKAVSI